MAIYKRIRGAGSIVPVAVLMAMAGGAAWAQEPATGDTFPRISGEVSIEVHGDSIRNDDDTDNNEITTTIEPVVTLQLTPELSIGAGLTLESVRDPEPNEDRVFEDHGLYVADLTLAYETDSFSVYGGKFGANFGTAWDAAPGLYGTDFAEDYELAERIGLGGSVTLGDEVFGAHTLSASAFFVDTTVLSRSAFTDRGRVNKTDGGPANTEGLNSVALALDGEGMQVLPGLRYHLGVARQKVDRVNDDNGDPKAASVIDDEIGFVAGVAYEFTPMEDVVVTPIVEWAHFNNFGGDDGVDRDYATAGLGAEYGSWNAALTYTGRSTKNPSDPDVDDSLFQVSAGYAFENGIGIDVGWKHTEEDNADADTAGMMVSYMYEF